MSKKQSTKVNTKPIGLAVHVFNHIEFDVYFNHLYCMREWAQKYKLILIGIKGLQAATARESMVTRAIDQGCSHILWLDGDHLVPSEMLDLLWERSHEAMVSGLVCKKGEEFQQVGWGSTKDGLYVPLNLPITGLTYEVAACAFGCTLINLSKLQKLTKPYFRDTCTMSPNGSLDNVRSDVNLCRMFREAGEKVMIDTRVLVGHHGVNLSIFPQNSDTIKKLLEISLDAQDIKKDEAGFYYK